MMDFDLEKTVGIDFGTSFSTISKYENGKVVLVEDEFQSPYIPTYISFIKGEYAFGKKAYENACSNTGNTVYEIKRLIGHSYGDEVVSKCLKQMPYEIIDDNNGGIEIELHNGESKIPYRIVDLIYLFVCYLKGLAERSLKHEVKNCIITVPSYFDATQRNIIHSAVEATQLKVLNILTEPTAAALAYSSIEKQYDGHTKTLAVYDFGGGTFDVSIIQNSYGTYEVLATSGDTEIGGKDLTRIVMDYLEEKVKAYPGCEGYLTTKQGLEILHGKAEQMKIDLTLNTSAVTYIQTADDEIEIVLERSEFEKRIAPLVERTIQIVLDCIKCVNMQPDNIESILLIGGSSFIPYITQCLKQQFPASEIRNTIDTRAAVATGALYYACLRKQGKELSEHSANAVVLRNPGEVFSAASLLKKQEEVNSVVVDGVTMTLQPPALPTEYENATVPFDIAVALIDKTLQYYPNCPNNVSMFDLYEKAGIELDIKNLDIESVNSADLLAHALTQSTMASYFKEQEQNDEDGQEVYENGEYVFNAEPAIFTDVTPLSIGYVDRNNNYRELISRNEKLPTSHTFRFSSVYSKNMSLCLTIAESHNPASNEYTKIGYVRLDNVPATANKTIQVIVVIAIDENNSMTVTIREKQSGRSETYQFNGIFNLKDKDVDEIRERNKVATRCFDERAYRDQFNDELYDKMKKMERFVHRTGDEDCKVTLMEMKEVLKRQDEFTVDQLKEIMGKVYTIMKMYNVS